MTDDPFAEAFQSIAEQSWKEPTAETLAWFTDFLQQFEDGPIPDLLVIARQETEDDTVRFTYHNNGFARERGLWLIESYRQWLMTGEDT